jgi:putative ABC transport system permease protein
LETVFQDLRFAWRGIRRHPGFAFVAVFSLAIGIGANTAIFSLVNSVLLQPLAYRDPSRVYAAQTLLPSMFGNNPTAVNPMQAREWGALCPSLEQVALMRGRGAQILAGGEPAVFRAADVPHNFFSLFGVEPLLGRAFLIEEEQEGNDRVVVLSESLWRSRFSGDRGLVGQSILVDGEKHTVVGIVRDLVPRRDVYRPLVLRSDELSRLTGNYNYRAFVRLRPGVAPASAIAEMEVVQERMRRESGSSSPQKSTLIPMHEVITGRARAGLWMLAASVGAVLLIVCVNLANLLLSRTASRGREAAIRAALGATRGRQIGQILTESLLLSVSGGVLGIVLAGWVLQLLVATSSFDIPRLEEVRLDGFVLAFAFVLTVLTGLLFGALPAWRFTRTDPQEALRGGGRGVTEGRGGLRIREALIGVEVGVSAALLIVASLLTSSLTRLLNVDRGFSSDRVLTVDVALAGSRYADDGVKSRFFDRVLASIGALPGVEAAGVITQLPTLGEGWNDSIYLEGAPREKRYPVNNRYTSPGYFQAMKIAVLSGRMYDESDRGQGVAVLSEKAARLLWPGESDFVGRMFMGEDDKLKTLVGIVAEVRATLASEAPATAYYPYWQRPQGGMALVVRTLGDSRGVSSALRSVLRAEDAQLPIPAIQTMEEVVGSSVSQRRFQRTLMTAFAVSGLLVASLGIYGVVSYSVARRRNEIGIRMALGASRPRLLGLVLRQGMAPVVFGLAGGVLVALLLGQAIQGLLFGVQPADPLTIVGVSAVLLLVGALACLVPARRAAGIDAIAALRFE